MSRHNHRCSCNSPKYTATSLDNVFYILAPLALALGLVLSWTAAISMAIAQQTASAGF